MGAIYYLSLHIPSQVYADSGVARFFGAQVLLLSKRYNSCSLGFLDNYLPFMAVLGLFRPFKELHLSQVIPDSHPICV